MASCSCRVPGRSAGFSLLFHLQQADRLAVVSSVPDGSNCVRHSAPAWDVFAAVPSTEPFAQGCVQRCGQNLAHLRVKLPQHPITLPAAKNHDSTQWELTNVHPTAVRPASISTAGRKRGHYLSILCRHTAPGTHLLCSFINSFLLIPIITTAAITAATSRRRCPALLEVVKPSPLLLPTIEISIIATLICTVCCCCCCCAGNTASAVAARPPAAVAGASSAPAAAPGAACAVRAGCGGWAAAACALGRGPHSFLHQLC